MIDPGTVREPLDLERASTTLITTHQAEKLTALVRSLWDRNQFYRNKFNRAKLVVNGLVFPDDLQKLPLTTKAELIDDQSSSPPWGTGLSEPISNFSRYNALLSLT